MRPPRASKRFRASDTITPSVPPQREIPERHEASVGHHGFVRPELAAGVQGALAARRVDARAVSRSPSSSAQSLTLLEHLIKNGTERMVEEARDHMHKLRSMTEFNYFEGSVDRGQGGESDVVEGGVPAYLVVEPCLPPNARSAREGETDHGLAGQQSDDSRRARESAQASRQGAPRPRAATVSLSRNRETHTVPPRSLSTPAVRRAEERQQRRPVGRHQQRWALW